MPSPRVALTVTYLGQLPDYFPYFLQSCAYNPTIDFLIFTDAPIAERTVAPNVHFHHLELADFNKLATERFGFPVHIKSAYKLCDLKPMSGFIYAEYLREYTHWGYCDIDMIMGQLDQVFTPALLAEQDVISSHPDYMSGALSIYRNEPKATQLFMRSRDWKRVLSDARNLYFDEAGSVIEHLWHGGDIADYPGEIDSMSHVVRRDEHSLRVKYMPIISERIQQRIMWRAGTLEDASRPVAVFHFLIYKGRVTFNVPSYTGSLSYDFTEHGFFLPTAKSYTVDWASSITGNLLSKVQRKLKRQWTKRLRQA